MGFRSKVHQIARQRGVVCSSCGHRAKDHETILRGRKVYGACTACGHCSLYEGVVP